MHKLISLFHRLRGLPQSDERLLAEYASVLSLAHQKRLRELVVTKQATLHEIAYPVSEVVLPPSKFLSVKPGSAASEHHDAIAELGAALRSHADDERFAQFAPNAANSIRAFIAPHLLGLDSAKDAIALQLVMPERFHILLLGDPGTGKTDLLRSACDLSPVSAFGLGSGASKAGLSATVVGKELRPGILAQAHTGLCAIDELNLLKVEDRGALYNAMEKGFLSFDKGGTHATLAADIRLLATANPKGDRFSGETLASMRKQLPFDAALLSRFHLLFIIRKPSGAAFRDISLHAVQAAKSTVSAEDIAFLKAYVARARSITPTLTTEAENTIADSVSRIRDNEHTVLIEVTPRLATGLRSLTLAHARLGLRSTVTQDDVLAATEILHASLTAGIPQPASAQTPSRRSTTTRPGTKSQSKPPANRRSSRR